MPSPDDSPAALPASGESDLAAEVAALRSELRLLNRHRFLRIQNSIPRMLLEQFVVGVMRGLGTVVGATLVVSLLILFLAQIELVPIIGEYATRIIDQIDRDLGR